MDYKKKYLKYKLKYLTTKKLYGGMNIREESEDLEYDIVEELEDLKYNETKLGYEDLPNSDSDEDIPYFEEVMNYDDSILFLKQFEDIKSENEEIQKIIEEYYKDMEQKMKGDRGVNTTNLPPGIDIVREKYRIRFFQKDKTNLRNQMGPPHHKLDDAVMHIFDLIKNGKVFKNKRRRGIWVHDFSARELSRMNKTK